MEAGLPTVLPVFAVSGALLLPNARISLTVFEPRYLAMTDDALGQGRLFALVQPQAEGALAQATTVAGLRNVGIAARIVAFGEASEGRYLITALGLNRFRLSGEEEGRQGYRRVSADYSQFLHDRQPENQTGLDREKLMSSVVGYMSHRGIGIDTSKLSAIGDAELVNTLAMAAPLSPEEKQALLESPTVLDRARLMGAMFEMALLSETGGSVLH